MAAVLEVAGASDVGLVRQNNEDAWGVSKKTAFYALADGMGGHLAGEIASHEAVSTVVELADKSFVPGEKVDIETTLRHAIEQANSRVHSMGQMRSEYRGMGTTLCCLHIGEGEAHFGHVGDSRIYRLRQGKLERLTKDHSLVAKLIDQGQLTEEEAGKSELKHVVTRAIGLERNIKPSFGSSQLLAGDIFLLCSDGLTDGVKESEIANILQAPATLETMTQGLIAAAKKKGGRDNITVILVRVNQL